MESYNEILDYCQQYANNNIHELHEKEVMKLYKFNKWHLGNVVRGMENECIGLFYYEEKDKELYLFYIKRDIKDSLVGLSFIIPLFSQYRDMFVFIFSRVLMERYKFKDRDEFSIANTYQHYIRTVSEEEGFITIDKEQLLNNEFIGGEGAFLISKSPVLDVKFFRRDSFLDNCFSPKLIEYALQDKYKTETKIYIMFNHINLLYKIGHSINPKTRERTLQGEDPKLKLVTCWIAPKSTEKELHELFKNKQIRGEWFKFSLEDLRKIRDYMKQYTPKEITYQ